MCTNLLVSGQWLSATFLITVSQYQLQHHDKGACIKIVKIVICV